MVKQSKKPSSAQESTAMAYAIFHSNERTSMLCAISFDGALAREYIKRKEQRGEAGYYVAGFQPLTHADLEEISK